MEMQGNATEIDERNLLQLDALLSHGYGLSPQLVMRSKGLSIEAKALYGYLSSFAGAGDTAFPSTSRILEELDISKNRFYKALLLVPKQRMQSTLVLSAPPLQLPKTWSSAALNSVMSTRCIKLANRL